MPGLRRYVKLWATSRMNKHHENPEPQKAVKPNRRRRIVLWALGIMVLVLLAIIISQQLWLWTILPPDTAADTVLLCPAPP